MPAAVGMTRPLEKLDTVFKKIEKKTKILDTAKKVIKIHAEQKKEEEKNREKQSYY